MEPAADLPVLMYHEISASPFGSARLAVSPRDFADQLCYLADQGFTGVTAADLAAAIAGPARLPDKPVALTFDDGFADFHETALPLLQKYGFTATLFMTTGWIRDGGHPAGRPPGPMLSWSQLAEVARAGIEIGAHSHQHPQLDQLAIKSVRAELGGSRAILEDGLGAAVTGLAYPYGYSNRRVQEVARQTGYSCAFAVGNYRLGRQPDLYTLPRLTVSRSTSLRRFGHIAACENLSAIFLKDRALTKGWAVLRHGRAAGRSLAGRRLTVLNPELVGECCMK
jgi:peptidoglycan/xylan/chitin deacetylase (PgdA/CDA1 family)